MALSSACSGRKADRQPALRSPTKEKNRNAGVLRPRTEYTGVSEAEPPWVRWVDGADRTRGNAGRHEFRPEWFRPGDRTIPPQTPSKGIARLHTHISLLTPIRVYRDKNFLKRSPGRHEAQDNIDRRYDCKMSKDPSAEQLLEDVVAMARTAGDATLEWFQNPDLDVVVKADGTPVTVADRTAEQTIRKAIADRYPGDGIVGEEEGATEGSGRRRWIIDPIDGTQAFVRGVPLYSTLVAVEDQDGVAAGAIHLPALGETVFAGRGLGCFHNGTKTEVSTRSELSEFVLSASGYGYLPKDMLDRLHASPMRLRTWGDGYGYFLVATGRIEVMIDPIVFVWDVAPVSIIIQEAGGVFTDFSGQAEYGSGNAVASNGTRHDEILHIVTGL